MPFKQLKYTVIGEVQGVCFPEGAVDEANSLGVGGWVQNSADGSVGGEAVGEAGSVKKFQ